VFTSDLPPIVLAAVDRDAPRLTQRNAATQPANTTRCSPNARRRRPGGDMVHAMAAAPVLSNLVGGLPEPEGIGHLATAAARKGSSMSTNARSEPRPSTF
jgi:hypothetical protein